MKLKCCSLKYMFAWTVLAALLLAGVLFFMLWGVSKIINSQIKSQSQLENNTDQWNRFIDIPFPISFGVRFFNVTNPDGVRNKNEKPRLTETELYVYNMRINKYNIRQDSSEEDSITYQRNLTFEYDESSKGKKTDNVTIINPVLLAALQITDGIERLAFAGCLKQLFQPDLTDNIFITASVDNILFEGLNFAFAKDSKLGVACTIVRTKVLAIAENLRNIEHVDNSDGNDYLRFSIFNYKRSGYKKEIPDGIYTINRGRSNIEELGNIIRWNSKPKIDKWGTRYSINNDSCNRVNGSDSTIYRPFLHNYEDLYIYSTDICRSVKLEYKNSDARYNGIQAFRYEAPSTLFRSSTPNPENDCFCTKSTKDAQGNENCYLDGVFDFKHCIGSPIVASMPHYLNADQKYLDNFEDLKPNETLHGIYLLLEPNTGTPLQARKRIQLNSILHKVPLLTSITPDNMVETVFPFLWLEESVDLPQEYVDLLNNQLFKKVTLANGIADGLVAVASVLFVIILFFLIRKLLLRNRTQ